jgi:hypothetical protein
MNVKKCAKCEKIKPIQDFNLRYTNSNSYQSRCKVCVVEDNKLYWLANKNKMKKNYKRWISNNPTHRKDKRLQKMYGITFAQYQTMITAQSGLCAICHKPESATNKRTGEIAELSVDHCHKTGQIRGLLCQSCNLGIGNLNDDPNLCLSAASYLEKSR